MNSSLTDSHEYFQSSTQLAVLKSSHLASPRHQKNASTHTVSPDLRWRQRKLIVQLSAENQRPACLDREWLKARLKNSPVKLIKLDLTLGQCLQPWAEACQQTNKKVFLRLPAMPSRPQNKQPISWWLKRQLDWVGAALLLIIFSPVILVIWALLHLESPQSPAFSQQWYVGERGQLLRCSKFRNFCPTRTEQTALENWLCCSKLDRLPLLFSVLRQEMSLVGSRPLTLDEAVQAPAELQRCLNALPGVWGTQQLEKYSNTSDIRSLLSFNLDYLQSWSLQEDAKSLLMMLLT